MDTSDRVLVAVVIVVAAASAVAGLALGATAWALWGLRPRRWTVSVAAGGIMCLAAAAALTGWVIAVLRGG